MAAFNLNPEGGGAAVYGKKEGTKGHAGFFEGNVHVKGNVHVTGELLVVRDIVLASADCAEDFVVADMDVAEPGTVMVVSDDGTLRRSDGVIIERVAGVVSGAGNYKPGIVLDKQPLQPNRTPIALLGKVYCKVDA